MTLAESLPLIIIVLIIGFLIGALAVRLLGFFGLKKSEEQANNIIIEAQNKAEVLKEKALNEAKEEIKRIRTQQETEIKEKKIELSNLERKLLQREENIDKRDLALQAKETSLDIKNDAIIRRTQELDNREKEITTRGNSIELELQKVAALTISEAREIIMKKAEELSVNEVTAYLRNKEEEAKEKGDQIARDILATTIEKYSQDVANDRTISVVSLPNDDLKGRIIGREGRNIRAIEQLTGVDLIIDDTPEVITVSCFDPIRREVAKTALEYLIKDGRIQPGRIEELVKKAQDEIQQSIHKAGEDTIFELGISHMPKELIDIIGRLKYRTSYGQNGLQHCKEVAILCGMMAAELGANQQIAKRAGLLHDIGKALDFEIEGSHVEIGVKICKKYGESFEVINAIESHHGDVPPQTLYANLVIAADTLSAARPGARSETLENYIQRIEKLETISKSFDGVNQAFAIQAGREIRVMVAPDHISDNQSYKLARDIRDKIENEMTYPGQIKVTVIREVRTTEVAK